MLKLVWLSESKGQKELWSQFNPSKQRWIVSDAKTKYFLNQSLLEKHDIINEPVKRAKEFWKELFKTQNYDFRIDNDLGTKITAKEFLKIYGKSEWCARPHAPERLIDAARNLGTLTTQDNADEILAQYSSEFNESESTFVELAKLSIDFYHFCIEKKNLPTFFLPFYLARNPERLSGEKELVFDLGIDLRDGERELIQELSKINDVTVIIPCGNKDQLEARGLYAYRNFELGLIQVENKNVESLSSNPNFKLWRCSSPEAEARQAVEQVRKWVSEGIDPSEICIAAPQIADYDDILHHDLIWEGIGFQRTLKAPLSSTRIFRAFQARLKIILGQIESGVLEEAFLSVGSYHQHTQRRLERRILKPVVDEIQVPQEEIKSEISKLRKLYFSTPQSVHQFEKVLITVFKSLVNQPNPVRDSHFLRCLQSLRTEIGDRHLDCEEWILAWNQVVTKVEVVNSPSDQSGVWGVDLSSCEESPADYIIILGSVEVTGRPSLTNSLSKERRGFFSSLGFYFSPPLKNKNDFIIEWLLTGERKEIIISNPKADSNGRSVSASPWWIKAAALQKRDLEHLDSAKETQWLHIQRAILNPDVDQKIDEFKNLPSEFTVSLASRLNLELQGLRTIELTPHHGKPFNLALSASHLEAYWECPFKFFARRHLNLFDEADLEVEPSPQVRGQWLHKAVEKIVSDERGLDQWTDEDLILLIDSLDKDQKKISSDVWPNIRSRFLRQIKRFIAYERDWQKYHPRIKPKHFEASINGFLKWNENEPASVTFETGEFSVPFRGSIDRIDVTADNKAIILDYKSSSSTASKNIGSWAKAGSFQLALYTLSTEAGLLEGGTYPVLAAQYYSLRRLEREKGFRLTDVDLSGILPESKSKSRVDLLQRNESFTEIKLEIHRILENIRLGKMTPKPHDEKLCVTCNWKNICRAPHLS